MHLSVMCAHAKPLHLKQPLRDFIYFEFSLANPFYFRNDATCEPFHPRHSGSQSQADLRFDDERRGSHSTRRKEPWRLFLASILTFLLCFERWSLMNFAPPRVSARFAPRGPLVHPATLEHNEKQQQQNNQHLQVQY